MSRARAAIRKPTSNRTPRAALRAASHIRVGFSGDTLDAVRSILSRHVQEARIALPVFLRTPNDESLHRFRVAVRRLRSTLKLYRKVSPHPTQLRKLLRRLARLTQMSNRARDLQVAQAVFVNLDSSERRSGSDASSRGRFMALLERRYEYALSRAVESLRLERSWVGSKLRTEMMASFKGLRTTADSSTLELQESPPSIVLQKLDRKITKRLSRSLKKIHSLHDEKSLHNARLCAKNLRYLLEPYAKTTARIERRIESLRVLQDILGELRDISALDHTIASALGDGAYENDQKREPPVRVTTAELEQSSSHDSLRKSKKRWRTALRRRSRRLFRRLESDWLRMPLTLERCALPRRMVLTLDSKNIKEGYVSPLHLNPANRSKSIGLDTSR